ncbi:MAG TPA: hypothetical protein VKB92_07890, partial [Myxococcales bacterium]|nr:hypothetical protein [Myxococcales bacterium]
MAISPTRAPALAQAHARVADRVAYLARRDLGVFAQFVLRNELGSGTGRIRLGQHHRQFVELVQREPRVVWESFAGSGKSQMALAFLLFSLGRNNNVRCVIASHTQGQASKIGRAARLYIERSAPLRRVFPGLRPGTGVWRDDAFIVERSGFQKDH